MPAVGGETRFEPRANQLLKAKLHIWLLVGVIALTLIPLGLSASQNNINPDRVKAGATATAPHNRYFAFIAKDASFPIPTPTITPTPFPTTLPPPIPLTGAPPLDFDAIESGLNSQGQALAFNKIGFHTGPAGNNTGLIEYMTELDAAGAPFVLKSVDDAGMLFAGQQLKKASGVPHILIWRRTGVAYDLPNYNVPPAQAAADHWTFHKDAFPPELDPSQVWIETVNEVDKNQSEWLAEFALETAQLAIADGFNWAAFGWSSGEPEPEHWEGEKMLAFLQFAGEHPDRIAIALHEYSYDVQNAGNGYPYLLGRFQALFDICDKNGIPRPSVLITEWGWEAFDVPLPDDAMPQFEWAAWLYAAYPETLGAATWYLGGGFSDIDDQTQRLIEPVKEYSLANYFSYTPGIGEIDAIIFEPPIWE